MLPPPLTVCAQILVSVAGGRSWEFLCVPWYLLRLQSVFLDFGFQPEWRGKVRAGV